MKVEVAYATADKQRVISLDVPRGTTVLEAIKLSKIQQHFPEIDLANLQVGIFSRKVALDTTLNEHDRVEIYRPLLIDPMQKRRLRAKRMSSTLFSRPEQSEGS